MNHHETYRAATKVVLTAAMILVLAGGARGEGAQDVVNDVFGPDLKRVRATTDRSDDIALAGKMLQTAQSQTDKPEMVAALCDTAYGLAMRHPKGYATAAEAMQTKGQHCPDAEADARAKLLAVRQKQYYTSKGAARTGAGEVFVAESVEVAGDLEDAGEYVAALKLARAAMPVAAAVRSEHRRLLQEMIKRLSLFVRIQTQVKQLATKLKADGDDQTVRDRLVSLYVMELDQPGEAAKCLNDACEETMRTYVPMAVKTPTDLPDGACVEMGDWYRNLAPKATAGKRYMLLNAKTYYELFLAKHTDVDTQRAKVELALQRVEADLAKLGRLPPGSWRDVLKLVDIKKHAAGGPWSRKGSAVGMIKPEGTQLLTFGTLTFPVVPKGSYEMDVSLKRTQGSGVIGVYIPIGTTRLTLALGWQNGQVSALNKIGGADGEDKVSVTPAGLPSGRAFKITVKVEVNDKDKTGKLKILLDGKDYLWWEGALSGLSRAQEPEMADPNAPGVAALQSRIVVNAARLRMLAGKLSPTKGRTRGSLPEKSPEQEWRERIEEEIDRWRRRR